MMQKSRTKITVLYESILEEEKCDLNWDEFFLLRSHPGDIEEIIRRLDEKALFARKATLGNLISECMSRILNRTDICFVNAVHTLSTITASVAHKIGLSDEAVDLLFTTKQLSMLIRRFSVLLVSTDVAHCIRNTTLSTIIKLITAVSDINTNTMAPYFAQREMMESVAWCFVDASTTKRYGNSAIRFFGVLLCISEKSSQVGEFLSQINHQQGFPGFAKSINDFLITSNDRFYEIYGRNLQDSSFVELLSTKLSSLFSSNDGKRESEFKIDLLDLVPLFVLYNSLVKNWTFVAQISAVRKYGEGPPTSILGNFLTNCSFVFQDVISDAGRLRSKLCLLIILRLTDDPYALVSIHGRESTQQITMYKSAMLHRPAEFDLNTAPSTIATSIVDLLAEYVITHLKSSSPLEFFDFSLGIVHRILAFDKQKCFRRNNWKPIFNALVSLLRFLVTHEEKLASIDAVCYRVIILLNVFITFGDTFLPSGDAYETVFYELVRHEPVFSKVNASIQQKEADDKADIEEREYLTKIRSPLSNVMAIISSIKPKLDVSEDFLSEEEVLHLIRESFDTLELKSFDGLGVVARYAMELHQITFFHIIALKIIGRVRQQMEEEEWNYSEFVQELSLL